MFNRLQTRMLAIFLSVVVLPIIIVGITIGFWSSNSLEEQSILLQGEITEKVNYEIQTYFNARFQEIELLDDVYSISVAPLDQQQAVLANLLNYHQHYQSLILLDANGNELVYSSRTSTISEGKDWETLDVYRLPLTGEFYYGPIYFDQAIREPLMEVAIPLVNLRTGKIVNIIVATIRFRPIWDLLNNIELPFEGDVYITDTNGQIVAHRNPTYVLRNTVIDIDWSESRRSIGLSSDDTLQVIKSFNIGDIEFSTIVEHVTSEVLAPANRIYQLTIGVIIGALTITIPLIVFLTRQITNPIKALAESAQTISRGDFSQSVQISGKDEIASLGQSFNEMRVQLDESITSLQHEIYERKAAEEQVIQINIDLQERVEQLNHEIQARRETIEALQASERRFSTVINAMNDLVYTLDREGRATQIFGQHPYIKSEDYVGKTSADLLGTELALPHNEAKVQVLRGEVVTYEWTHPSTNGSIQHYQTVLSPIYDSHSKVIGIIGVRRNITKSKLAEQQRIELALEHKRSQLLRDFITQASHEFRTPLSIISTSTYLLERVTKPQDRGRHVDQIQKQIFAITTLVDNLTTLTNLDNLDDIIRQTININDIIATNLGIVQTTVQQKSLDIQFEKKTMSPMRANHDLIFQAIQVILDNAITFSPDNGIVKIDTIQDETHTIISISNTGQGIPDKDLPHIFERFFRSDTQGTTRGFGLGLPIAKTIVEKHNGTIEVQSTIGQETTAIIRLPHVE